MKLNPLLLSIVLSLTLAGCGKNKQEETAAPAEPSSASAPAAMDQGQAPAGAVPSTVELTEGMSGNEIYAAKCVSCHGDVGQGIGDNPKLAGLTVADIESRLKSYREGKQMGPKTAVMATQAKTLTDEQITALAEFLGE